MPLRRCPAQARRQLSAEDVLVVGGIAELLDRYKAALESRSVEALKRVWPGLSQAQESAVRLDFQNSKRVRVEILGPQITARGSDGAGPFVRRYEVQTVDGQRLERESRTTMTAHRSGAIWVIDQIRFEPLR